MTLWCWHQQIGPPNCPCQELRKLVILARPHGFYHKSVIAFSKLLRSVELSEVSSLSMFGYLVMPVVSSTKGMPLRQFLRPRLNLHRGLIMASCGCQNAPKDVWLQKHKGLCVFVLFRNYCVLRFCAWYKRTQIWAINKLNGPLWSWQTEILDLSQGNVHQRKMGIEVPSKHGCI